MVDESSRPPWRVWLHPRWWYLLKRWRQAVRRWREVKDDHYGWELEFRFYNQAPEGAWRQWLQIKPVAGCYPHQFFMPDDLRAELVTIRLTEPHRYARITMNWS